MIAVAWNHGENIILILQLDDYSNHCKSVSHIFCLNQKHMIISVDLLDRLAGKKFDELKRIDRTSTGKADPTTS